MEGVLRTARSAPHQALAGEVVDIRDVDVTAFSGDLIDPNVGQVSQVLLRQAIGDRLLDRRRHGAPRAPQQPRDLLPGQGPGPRREHHHERAGHLLFAADPRQRFDMDASAPSTPYAPWRIAERHRDPPQWHVPKAPCSPRVPVPARRPALATAGRKPQVWDQLSHQSTRVPRDRHHSKPLQFHRRLDQTFQEHASPLRYPGCVATPKYLMRLMFFNSQPASACIHSCDGPLSEGNYIQTLTLI